MDADVVMEPTAPVQAAPEVVSAPAENTEVPASEPVPEQGAEQAAEPSGEQGGEQGASGGARRAPRPSQGPPQKGTSLFPTARVAKIIKVRTQGVRHATDRPGRQCRGYLQQGGNLPNQHGIGA